MSECICVSVAVSARYSSECAVDWSRRNDDSGTLDGMDSHMKTVEDTAAMLLKVVDSATRETNVFMNFDGATNPW
jgi:hypothetical protein